MPVSVKRSKSDASRRKPKGRVRRSSTSSKTTRKSMKRKPLWLFDEDQWCALEVSLKKNIHGKVELVLSKTLKMEFGLEDRIIKVRLLLRHIVAIEKQIADDDGKFPFALFTMHGCCLLASSSEAGRSEWCREMSKYIGQDFFFGMTAPPQEAFLPHPPAGVVKLHINPDRRVLLLTVNSVPEDKLSVPVALRSWRFDDVVSFGCTDRFLVIRVKGEGDQSRDYYCFDTLAAVEILAHLKQAIGRQPVGDSSSSEEDGSDDEGGEENAPRLSERGGEGAGGLESASTTAAAAGLKGSGSPLSQHAHLRKENPYRQSLLKALEVDRAVLVESRPRLARYDSIKCRRSSTSTLTGSDTPPSGRATPIAHDRPDPMLSNEPEGGCPVVCTEESPSPPASHKRRFSLTINSPLLKRLFGSGGGKSSSSDSTTTSPVGGKSERKSQSPETRSSPKQQQQEGAAKSSSSSPFVLMRNLLSPRSRRQQFKDSPNSLSVPEARLRETRGSNEGLSDAWDSGSTGSSSDDVLLRPSPSASPMFQRKTTSRSLTDLHAVAAPPLRLRLGPLPLLPRPTPPSPSAEEGSNEVGGNEHEQQQQVVEEGDGSSASQLDVFGEEESAVADKEKRKQHQISSSSSSSSTAQPTTVVGRVLPVGEEESLSSDVDTVSPLPRARHHSFTEMIQGMFAASSGGGGGGGGSGNGRRSSLERCRSPLSSHSQSSTSAVSFCSDTLRTSTGSLPTGSLPTREEGVDGAGQRQQQTARTSLSARHNSEESPRGVEDFDRHFLLTTAKERCRGSLKTKSTSVGDICGGSSSTEGSIYTFMDAVVEMQDVTLSHNSASLKRQLQLEKHSRSKSTSHIFPPRTKSFHSRPLPRAPGDRTVAMATSASSIYENDDSRLYQNMRRSASHGPHPRSDPSGDLESSHELYENMTGLEEEEEHNGLVGHYAQLDFSNFVAAKKKGLLSTATGTAAASVVVGENGRPRVDELDADDRRHHPLKVPLRAEESIYTVIDSVATEAMGLTLRQRQEDLKSRSVRKKRNSLRSPRSLSSLESSSSLDGHRRARAWSTAGRLSKSSRQIN